MAGPAPSTNGHAPAPSASVSGVAKESTFPIPPPTALEQLKPSPTASVVLPPPIPSERVIVPPRGTLAAGKYEAKPATIWIVVAIGALLLLSWALFRVRRAQVEKKRRAELLTSLRKPGTPAS
jgi:hypothetical protein